MTQAKTITQLSAFHIDRVFGVPNDVPFFQTPPGRFLKKFVSIVALSILYVLTAKFGLFFAHLNDSISVIWPPTGVAIATLILLGQTMAIGVFLGAFIINLSVQGTVVSAFFIAAGNMLEAMVAAYLVTKYAGGRFAYEKPTTVFRFAIFAALIAPLFSATIGVATLVTTSLAEHDFFTLWFTWWLGDATAAILFAPVIIAWANEPHFRWEFSRMLEFFVFLLVILLFSQLIFSPLYFELGGYPVAGIILPILAWAAIRFSFRETVTAILFFAAVAAMGTLAGYGPYTVRDTAEPLILLALLTSSVMLTFQILSVVVAMHKKTEEALLLADRTKDEFIATLAHELRNPLAPITNYVELLKLPTDLTESKATALVGIESNVKKMTHLLDDIRDLARVRIGTVELVKDEIDLKMIIEHAILEVRPEIEESQHTFTVSLPDHSALVFADALRIEQVVTNLLTNACKYTPRGGKIQLKLTTSDDTATVMVKDNGIGIERSKLTKVWNAFEQIPSSPAQAKRQQGMGIGLRLVKVYTEVHGGSVSVESEGIRKGSTFIVRLPLVKNFTGEHSSAQPTLQK